MEDIKIFEEFFTSHVNASSVPELILNLILVAAFAHFLAKFYIKYGRTLSNRKDFSNNFITVAMATMLIITIIKSSLALSLGLIGALSIVRFRAAIKDPEELTYLFLAIALGLGIGAQQTMVTIISFLSILLILYIRQSGLFGIRKEKQWQQDLHLIISTEFPKLLHLDLIQDLISQHCQYSRTKRVDKTETSLEYICIVEFKDKGSLEAIDAALRSIDDKVKISFMDLRGGMTGTS